MRVEAESHKRVRPLEPDAVNTDEGRSSRETVHHPKSGGTVSLFFGPEQIGQKAMDRHESDKREH